MRTNVAEVVAALWRSGGNMREAAHRLGVQDTTVRYWRSVAIEQGVDVPPVGRAGRPSLAELAERVARARPSASPNPIEGIAVQQFAPRRFGDHARSRSCPS
jgi:transposase-like protein